MREPTVADELAWSALPEEQRALYLRVTRRVLRAEFLEEISEQLDAIEGQLAQAKEAVDEMRAGVEQ